MLSFFCKTRSRRWHFVVLVSAWVLSSVSHANAQGGVGSSRGLPDSASGIHSIQGRVYLPSGRRAGPGLLVRLEGNVNGTRTAATDGDGAFTFNGLPAAEYQLIVVGGAEYDTVRQSVVIYGTTGNVGAGRSAQT